MHDVLPEDQVYFKKVQKAVEAFLIIIVFRKLKLLFWKTPKFLQKQSETTQILWEKKCTLSGQKEEIWFL